MFAFQPTANRVGDYLSQGVTEAAKANAMAMDNIGQNIGGALTTLAAAYGQRQGTIAKGKNFKKFMGMAGDTFGMDGSMFADMEDYDAGMMLDNFGSWMPAMANAQLGSQRLGVSQQGQQLQREMPTRRAMTNAAAQVASGQGTYVGLPPGVNPDAIITE